MPFNYKHITDSIDIETSDYFKNYKNEMIARSIKFIKNSLRDGHGETFIDSEKDSLRKMISSTSIDELIVVERNLLTTRIKLNLNSVSSNRMKQIDNKRAMKAKLIKKLLKKQSLEK
tara:strand:+ start:1090 stop:1440 length:351 start_codon:yes stop_codon:yes gene_type:complete